MTIPYLESQLKLVLSVVEHRLGWLDPFFLLLNFFDTKYFYLVLLTVVLVGIHYRAGLRFYSVILLNSWLNSCMKLWMGWPRPFIQVPGINQVELGGYGFPSGAAEHSILLAGLCLVYTKKRSWHIGAISYVLLMSFSRIYLGVHYPIDIVGGWLLGAAVCWLYVKLSDPIAEWMKKQAPIVVLVSVQAVLMVLCLLSPGNQPIGFLVGAMGINLGAFCTFRYRWELPVVFEPQKIVVRTLAALVGALFVHLIFANNMSETWGSLFLLHLWLACGVGVFFTKFRLV